MDTTSNPVLILLGAFALFLSGVIVIAVSGWLNRRSLEKKKEESYALICDIFLSKISHEWSFVDSLVEAFFSDADEALHQALRIYAGEHVHLHVMQTMIVDGLVVSFQNAGIVEMAHVIYSKENLTKNPHMFKLLPQWSKEECEHCLSSVTNEHEGAHLMQVKKVTSSRGGGRHQMMKDIGMNPDLVPA